MCIEPRSIPSSSHTRPDSSPPALFVVRGYSSRTTILFSFASCSRAFWLPFGDRDLRPRDPAEIFYSREFFYEPIYHASRRALVPSFLSYPLLHRLACVTSFVRLTFSLSFFVQSSRRRLRSSRTSREKEPTRRGWVTPRLLTGTPAIVSCLVHTRSLVQVCSPRTRSKFLIHETKTRTTCKHIRSRIHPVVAHGLRGLRNSLSAPERRTRRRTSEYLARDCERDPLERSSAIRCIL